MNIGKFIDFEGGPSSAGSSADMRRSLVRDLPYTVESDQIV
jgi:hypothetical protein